MPKAKRVHKNGWMPWTVCQIIVGTEWRTDDWRKVTCKICLAKDKGA